MTTPRTYDPDALEREYLDAVADAPGWVELDEATARVLDYAGGYLREGFGPDADRVVATLVRGVATRRHMRASELMDARYPPGGRSRHGNVWR